MRVLMIGDVVGRPGRKILLEKLNDIVEEFEIDFVNANLENASGGNGVTKKNLDQLLQTPIDSVTMGNHTFDQRETLDYIDDYPNMVRPLDYPATIPGKGYTVLEKNGVKVGVINVSCLTFMNTRRSPFEVTEEVLPELEDCDIILVDLHGEATSEKIAYGYNFDGRVSAVVGTHTHVQTADNRVLPNGTAYISDLGMTGPLNGVIGVKADLIVDSFKTGLKSRHQVELGRPWQFNAVVIDIDESTGKARSIERIYRVYE